MAAIGALKVPHSTASLAGERANLRATPSQRLSCASSHLSGDKISPKSAAPRRRSEASAGDRTRCIVSPKATSGA
ncbi:unnamed protein product [Camellia sinensis]